MLKPRIARILFELKEQGQPISQTQISKALGVSKQQVSSWVNGRTYPRAEKLFRLAQILNCKVDDLYDFEGN